MKYTWQGQPVENVYAVQRFSVGPLSVADLTDIGGVFAGWETGVALPYRSNTVTYNGCSVRDLTTESSPEVEVSTGAGTVGGRTANPLPNNVTFCLKLSTGLVGRSFRGRTYWIGLVYDQITGNVILHSGAVDIRGIMNQLLTFLTSHTTSYALGVLSLHHNGAARTAGVFTSASGYSFTDEVLDSQRRRLPAHNRHH